MLKITWNTHNYFHTFGVISDHGCFIENKFYNVKSRLKDSEFLSNGVLFWSFSAFLFFELKYNKTIKKFNHYRIVAKVWNLIFFSYHYKIKSQY